MRKIWIALLVMVPCLFARGDEKNCREGAGYFTFIEGIPGPFFTGPLPPSEATAFFRFTTARFSTVGIPNGECECAASSPGDF